MRIGKLNNIELKENIFDIISPRRKEITARASLSEDCAAFNSGETVLVSTDPITGDAANIGSLAVTVSTNDIIAGGGEPFMVLLTIILPINEDVEKVKIIMADAEKAAERLNVEIAGGHTEFSDAVNRPIVNAVALGFADKHIKASCPKSGDYIIITKDIALEGTQIAIENYKDKLKDFLSRDEFCEGESYKDEISVFEEGKIAKKSGVNAMHDITEGGVFGAVCEMCQAGGVGALIDVDSIPVRSLTDKVCAILGLDKYRLISSGSLIITIKNKDELLAKLKENDIKATVIGKITEDKCVIADFGYRKEQLSVTQDQLFLKYLNNKI